MTPRMICLSCSDGLTSTSEVWLFSPQVFHQNCRGKSIIFGYWVEIYLNNWNKVDIPVDDFEPNVQIIRNSICAVAVKNEYSHSGWKDQFFWMSSFLLCPSLRTYSYQQNPWPWVLYLFNNLLPLCWYCLKCQSTWTSKIFCYDTGHLGSVCIVSKNSCHLLKFINLHVLVMKGLLSSLLF